MRSGRIVLIRHADFFKPVKGAYYGQSDLPLTEAGETQAARLECMLPHIAPDIERVYVSDLMRAVRTAQLALPGHGLISMPALRELSFGEWEGKRYDEVKDLPQFAAYACGGAAPGGESQADFAARVTGALDSILSECPDGCIAIVAHSGSIRAIIAHMLGLGAEGQWRFMVDTASVSIITISDGYAYLSALNAKPLPTD